jgi:hypothetical protein
MSFILPTDVSFVTAYVTVIILMPFIVTYFCSGSTEYKPNVNFETNFVVDDVIQLFTGEDQVHCKVISEPEIPDFDIVHILILL